MTAAANPPAPSKTNRGRAPESERGVIRGAILIPALVTLGVVIAGCSHDNNAGVSTTTTTKASWDPCSLTPDALQRAGVGPATMERGVLGTELPNSKTCQWTGGTYDIEITASSTTTVEEVRARKSNHDFANATVGGRQLFTFKSGVEHGDSTCFLGIPFQTGGFAYLQIGRSALTNDQTPTCDTAVRVGNILAAEMPR